MYFRLKYENYFDLYFTSPPYFGTELYGSENKESQSWFKYPNFVSWRDDFLLNSFNKLWKSMKQNSYFCVNIVDPKDKKVVIELDFDGNIIEKIPPVIKPKPKFPIVTEEKIKITQYKGCFRDQRDIPWLKEIPWVENVKKTFIAPPPNESKDLISEYCFLKEKVQIGRTNWYPVKKNFSSLYQAIPITSNG